MKRKHPKRIKKEIKDCIKKHLQKPELFQQFLIFCPEHKCRQKKYSSRKDDLKSKLFTHMFKSGEHSGINYSEEFLVNYVNQHYTRIFVSEQKRQENLEKRIFNIPNNAYWSLHMVTIENQQRLVNY